MDASWSPELADGRSMTNGGRSHRQPSPALSPFPVLCPDTRRKTVEEGERRDRGKGPDRWAPTLPVGETRTRQRG
uniref:Predicted protein n=1 Tax=Hordeum vulgare subsp. vulgare TaxID=112509 RepID=F2D0Z3_HORVV|nr:predicted protein [Hordeum vulgare subsp. vulgare]